MLQAFVGEGCGIGGCEVRSSSFSASESYQGLEVFIHRGTRK